MSDDKKNLFFILIASGTKPLASYSQFTGDFIQTCENFLQKVKPNKSSSVNYGEFFIFYNNEDNITYLIMTAPTFPKATAVGCIESLRKEFHDVLYGRDFENTQEYGLSDELKEKLKMKFDYFNEHPEVSSESIERLKVEINKMNEEVIKANEQLLVRDQKMIEMENKAEQMKDASSAYKAGAIKVKKKESRNRIWVYLGIILAILIIIYIIIAQVCSWDFKC